MSVGDTSVEEDNGPAVITVSLSHASAIAVDVRYATAARTARAGADYSVRTGTVTIPPGATGAAISVPIVSDPLDESEESFVVNLSMAEGAKIDDSQATVTIVDDDDPPRLTVSSVTVTEGAAGRTKNAIFTVTLSAPSGRTVGATYQTQDGSAVAPLDYVARTGTLTFPPGSVSQTLAVRIKGDGVVEGPEETFMLAISAVTNAVGAGASGIGHITDDDGV